jgi:hypothetical protein
VCQVDCIVIVWEVDGEGQSVAVPVLLVEHRLVPVVSGNNQFRKFKTVFIGMSSVERRHICLQHELSNLSLMRKRDFRIRWS